MTQPTDGLVCALPDRSSQEEIRRFQDANVIREILHTARTVAIVGLSSNSLRPSNYVGFYLQRHGYRVIPVNPKEREVLGEKAYASLADVPFPIDVVDVFRASQFVPGVAEEAVKIGAKALWLQFGVISSAGAQIAEQGGLKVVEDRCMKVEHARHMGRMHWLGFNTGVVISQRTPDAR
jgi:predicted CoA-binding protein